MKVTREFVRVHCVFHEEEAIQLMTRSEEKVGTALSDKEDTRR